MIKIIFILFGVALNGDCTLYDRHIWLKKNLILLNEKSNLLDVGCGNGSVAIDIASLRPNSDVIGVDINKKTLAHKKSLANISFDSNSKIGTKKIIIGVITELIKRKTL